ncbi:MAG: energy transducer TonB, partial [Candidatus Acidiferrales bacterium]
YNPASPAALKELERLALGHLDTNPVQGQQEPVVARRPPKGAGRAKDSKRTSPARVSPARVPSELVSTDLADLQQPYQHQPASSAAALHSFTSSSGGGGVKESVQPAAAPGTEKLTFGNFLKDPEPRTSAQRVFSEHSDVMSASILAATPPLHATQTRSSSNFLLLVAAAVIFCAAGGLIVVHSMNNASSKPAVVGKPWAEQTPAPPGNLKPNAERYELPDSSSGTSLPDSSDVHSATPESGLEVDLTTAVTPPSKNGASASPKQGGRRIPALNLSAPTSDSDSDGPSSITVEPPPVVSSGSAAPISGESLSTYAANPNANIPRPAAANPAAASPAATSPVAANPLANAPAVKAPAAKTPAPISAGGVVTQPRLIWSSSPVYPTLAKQANIQGDVKLEITINESGRVSKTKVLSGPTLLQQPAINAVRDWKYTPSTLDGKPVPFQLIVTVQFRR